MLLRHPAVAVWTPDAEDQLLRVPADRRALLRERVERAMRGEVEISTPPPSNSKAVLVQVRCGKYRAALQPLGSNRYNVVAVYTRGSSILSSREY